jgi:hypothetical protein
MGGTRKGEHYSAIFGSRRPSTALICGPVPNGPNNFEITHHCSMQL